MKKYISLFFLSLLLLCSSSSAQDMAFLHAKGHACEEIKTAANKSAARAQASDKASFNAVENLDVIKNYKNKFNEHDFNILIYSLVDSVLEGVSVQTTSEDEKQICVEVNAMADEKKLRDELGNALKERGAKSATDVVIDSIENDMTNKPKNIEETLKQPEISIENRALVFVAPTVFYNGATSDNHSKLLQHYLADNENFYLTDSEEIADFIIYPRVGKARIDENDEIKRLQMQTLISLVNSDGEQIAQDEQNRAILCDEAKTEQQNAQGLLKKMFAKSAKRIAIEIENFEKNKLLKNNLSSK